MRPVLLGMSADTLRAWLQGFGAALALRCVRGSQGGRMTCPGRTIKSGGLLGLCITCAVQGEIWSALSARCARFVHGTLPVTRASNTDANDTGARRESAPQADQIDPAATTSGPQRVWVCINWRG